MIRAIFFDQDGVIVDTEKDGHRVSFNSTFREFGFPVEWGVDEYHELLQIAGGKERMRHYLHTRGFGRPVPAAEEDELIAKMHKRKTAAFIELIESGALPLRPGVRRLMSEAKAASLVLGVCTTSDERAAGAIAGTLLEGIALDFILAGDIVKKKKPDPEIYLLALARSGLSRDECVVVEDSRNGVEAARAAGLRVIVTTSAYTASEDLSGGDLILSCLGDPGGERARLIKGPPGFAFDGVLTVDAIQRLFGGAG